MADINIKKYGVIGDVTNPYQQAYYDTCAIKSQQLILKDFGVEVTEDQLVQYSTRHGWYNGDGTALEDVGKILVDAGIPCTQSFDANIYDLTAELAQGHKVIVAVDSGELWNNGLFDWLKDLFCGNTPDHALIVAGIDMSDPENPMVVLTDPGTGQPAQPYPLDQFMDAWADSQHFMVSTDVATPKAAEWFDENGLSDNHLPDVCGVDYDTFCDFQTYSHLIEPGQLSDLNDAFDVLSLTPNGDFINTIASYSLPTYDMAYFPHEDPSADALAFAYDNLDTSWLDGCFSTEYDSTNQTIETLTNLHSEALEQVQQCLDDGMYIAAHMWQHEAHDLQDQIDNLQSPDSL